MVEESRRYRASGFRIALDLSTTEATEATDEIERARQRSGGHAFAAMSLAAVETRAAWALPVLTRSYLRSRFGAVSPTSRLGCILMHQQPPKIPLLRSTNSAKAGHDEASRARAVKSGMP